MGAECHHQHHQEVEEHQGIPRMPRPVSTMPSEPVAVLTALLERDKRPRDDAARAFLDEFEVTSKYVPRWKNPIKKIKGHWQCVVIGCDKLFPEHLSREALLIKHFKEAGTIVSRTLIVHHKTY